MTHSENVFDPWFMRPGHKSDARIRLFCFSHAGGAASAYHSWHSTLKDVETWGVQLPGREGRVQEPLITEMRSLIQRIADAMSEHLQKPFAFFGHSMGAVVAFETAREFIRRGLPCPEHIYVSGRPAPHLPPVDPPMHDLPDTEFLEELKRRFNGLPAAILAEPELLALFLPILRSDLRMMETHSFDAEPPLPVSLTAYCGKEDRIMTEANLAAWSALTSRAFDQCQLPGGHFYLHEQRGDFLDFFSNELNSLFCRVS